MKVIKTQNEIIKVKKPKKAKVIKEKKPLYVNKDLVINYLNQIPLSDNDKNDLLTLIENNDILQFSSGYATFIKFKEVKIWITGTDIKITPIPKEEN